LAWEALGNNMGSKKEADAWCRQQAIVIDDTAGHEPVPRTARDKS